MNPKIQLVQVTCEQMKASVDSVIACALVYNQGNGYKRSLYIKDVKEEKEWFDIGVVSPFVVDFCLDYMSGRIHPNKLCNALMILGKKKGGKK